MADAFPTFAPDGTMLGNLTSSQGSLPALPSLGSIGTPTPVIMPTVGTSSGGAAGSAGTVTPTATATAPTPSNTTTPAPTAATGIQSGSIADYFLRGVIIILGFIFVAIGLNMFRPGVVPDPRNVVGN